MRCDKAPISCLWEGIWSSGDILFICAAFEEGDLGDHDFVEYTYYLDGCVATMTDQRCVVHTYQYDVNGRQVSDAVTTLPDGVDGSVRRIDRAYDDQGRLQRVTSYDSPSGGTAVNEVRYDYDAWGDLLAIWQAHDGNVTASSPKLGYAYETSVSGQSMSFIRRAGVTLPSGRSLAYDYAGTVNTALSRLAGVKDAATQATLAAFTYLGASTIVGESRPSVGLGYTLVGEYGGLDALGRVTELYWKVGGEFIDDFCYGYDAAGNRTWRAQYDGDSGAEVHDEAYQYDGLNRLTETRRGTLDWDDFTITDPTSSQSWALDAVGNWDGFTTDGTTQTRSENGANELTSVAGWITPQYDKAGNMTVAPKPGAESTTGFALTYDAWNRLVRVDQWTDANGNHAKDSGESLSLVATYRYDGLGQRIAKTLADGTRFDYYYNENWQVLEVRKNGAAYEQYLWDPAYVDTPVMRWRNADGNSSNGLEEVVYYTSDANHNVTALVDGTPTRAHYEEVVERYVYTSYGTPTFLKNDWSPQVVSGHADGTASLFDNVQLYSGYPLDPETGLFYARHRYYAPSLGLWTGRDPARDGADLYEYCGNRPTNATDPSGLEGLYLSADNYVDDLSPAYSPPQGMNLSLGAQKPAPLPEWTNSVKAVGNWVIRNVPYAATVGVELTAHDRTGLWGFAKGVLLDPVIGKMRGDLEEFTSGGHDTSWLAARAWTWFARGTSSQIIEQAIRWKENATTLMMDYEAFRNHRGHSEEGAFLDVLVQRTPVVNMGLMTYEFVTGNSISPDRWGQPVSAREWGGLVVPVVGYWGTVGFAGVARLAPVRGVKPFEPFQSGVVAGDSSLFFDSGIVSQYTGPGAAAAIRTSSSSFVYSGSTGLNASMMLEPLYAINGLQPGPFAMQAIRAAGPGRNFTVAEHATVDAIGNQYGCHSCGSMNPGTSSGHWVLDHQLPSQMILPGQSQWLYPQCLRCMRIQGGQMRAAGY